MNQSFPIFNLLHSSFPRQIQIQITPLLDVFNVPFYSKFHIPHSQTSSPPPSSIFHKRTISCRESAFRNRSRSKAWKQLGPSGNKVAQWLFERTNWSGLVAERCNIVKGYGSRARPLWGWGQEEEAAASQILSADIQCDITHSTYGLSSGMHARVRAGRETEREWIFAHDSIYKATFDLIFRKLFFEKLSSIIIEFNILKLRGRLNSMDLMGCANCTRSDKNWIRKKLVLRRERVWLGEIAIRRMVNRRRRINWNRFFFFLESLFMIRHIINEIKNRETYWNLGTS